MKRLNCWQYLSSWVDEQHLLWHNADYAWRGNASLADLLGQENVGTKQRQGGHDLWKRQRGHCHQEIEEGKRREEKREEKRLPINCILASWGPSDCMATIWPWQKELISSILVCSSSSGGRYCFICALERIRTISVRHHHWAKVESTSTIYHWLM